MTKVTADDPVIAVGFEPYDSSQLTLNDGLVVGGGGDPAVMMVMTAAGVVVVYKGEEVVGRISLKDHFSDASRLRQLLVLSGGGGRGGSTDSSSSNSTSSTPRMKFLSVMGGGKTEALVEVSHKNIIDH